MAARAKIVGRLPHGDRAHREQIRFGSHERRGRRRGEEVGRAGRPLLHGDIGAPERERGGRLPAHDHSNPPHQRAEKSGGQDERDNINDSTDADTAWGAGAVEHR